MHSHTPNFLKLDCYHVAADAARVGIRFAAELPPGFAHERSQITRAVQSVVRNLCEGAGRRTSAEKVHKFSIANGEAYEAYGAVDCLVRAGVGDAKLGREYLQLTGRVMAMLHGLMRFHG